MSFRYKRKAREAMTTQAIAAASAIPHREDAPACRVAILAPGRCESRSEPGFSLLEVLIAIAIVFVMAGITAPKIRQMIQAERLRTTASAYASFLQRCRYQATHDGQWYEILIDNTGPTPIAYLDMNLAAGGNSQRQAGEPAVEIPYPLQINDAGVPGGFDVQPTALGTLPLNLETQPAMVDHDGTARAGLAFNERGLPCQSAGANAACTNSTTITTPTGPANVAVAWITYIQYPIGNGTTWYAAVTVSPAGRVKVWNYQGAAGGGGSWQ
jgi:prepilin-type N-terminal cleavage/methylation domain-containing protein